MLSEEALGELPGFRKVATLFEAGMHPVNGDGGVLDAVASLRIVADYLAGAAVAALVYLVENGGEVFGDADAVLVHQADDGLLVEERLEELQEEAARVEAESPADDVIREVVGRLGRSRGNLALLWRRLLLRRPLPAPVRLPEFRMLFEVVGRRLVVGAGGLVVAAAYSGIKDFAGIIDVGTEAVRPVAGRAGQTGRLALVRC